MNDAMHARNYPRLTGRWLVLARIAWLVFFALALMALLLATKPLVRREYA